LKRARLVHVLAKFAPFFAGQGAAQLLALATSLLLLRALNVEQYAQYSLAVGLQMTASALANLGLNQSIIPLVGARVDDRVLIGRLVKGALFLRIWLVAIVTPVVLVFFHLAASKQGWTLTSQLLLSASIVLAIVWSGQIACYSAPLIIQRRFRDYYFAQVAPAALRLGIYLVAAAVGMLTAAAAALVGSLTYLMNAVLVRRSAKNLVQIPANADPATNREMIRTVLPMAPATVFSAFQPQIALFVITVFGETQQIAEVGALGRLAQLFLVWNVFSDLVIGPYIARMPQNRLLYEYLRLVALAFAAMVGVSTLAAFFPGIFLLLLGESYVGLREPVFWTVLGSSMSSFAGVIWVMSRARKWIFWRGSFLEIILLFGLQALFVATVGVDSTLEAAQLMVMAGVAHVLVHSYIAWHGFRNAQGIET
jgi:O-antigen/teichoic acid export membrane protein